MFLLKRIEIIIYLTPVVVVNRDEISPMFKKKIKLYFESLLGNTPIPVT